MAIRLVLAEDSFLVREGIRRLLATRYDVEIVASSTSCSEPSRAGGPTSC